MRNETMPDSAPDMPTEPRLDAAPDNTRDTHARAYLELTLAEAQATVRAYDTKAQIVGIGYTFAINIVARVVPEFPLAAADALWPVLVFWGLVMVPLFLFGYVLYPSRRIAPRVARDGGAPLRQVLYVETARHGSVEALEEAARGADWLRELSFEILKVSRLRELKRGRFIRALWATAAAFAFLAAAQLLGVLV